MPLAGMLRGERAYVVCQPSGYLDDLGFHEIETIGFTRGRNAKDALRRFQLMDPTMLSSATAVPYSRATEKMLVQGRDAEAKAYGNGG